MIKELGKSDDKIIMDIDYQMFWFESLGFPCAMPLFRGKVGNTMGWYRILPSDFNLGRCQSEDMKDFIIICDGWEREFSPTFKLSE